jgi:hypothetical protein
MSLLQTRLHKRIYVSLYALLFLTVLLGLSVLLEGCSDKCEVTNEYTYYKPVYTDLATIRSSVRQVAPAPVTAIGKIYFKDGILFVNQPGEGIHVIDNHDPSRPVVVSFVEIPGNNDLAVKGNILYADSYVDLVALDISNIQAIHEIKRLENAFSTYNTIAFQFDPANGVITEWEEQTDVKVYQSECDAVIQPWGGFYYADGIALSNGAVFDRSAAITPGTGSGPGVGGSMARFTINSDHLYVLDGGDVQSVDITQENNPVMKGRTTISWDMETIFPYKQNLFIGSRTGMHILDISNPASPVKISTYAHVRVCDPVVVQDTLAYVTLRSGTSCEGFTNQLEVINIKNLNQPVIVKTYPMSNPHGLGIDGSTLFICDGAEGLKIYDASDIHTIDQRKLAHYKEFDAFDVIPFNDVLMMIGADGIVQYSYADPKKIQFLSKITLVNED